MSNKSTWRKDTNAEQKAARKAERKTRKAERQTAGKAQGDTSITIFDAEKDKPEVNNEGKIKTMHGGVERWI